jgi:hypothetical protein
MFCTSNTIFVKMGEFMRHVCGPKLYQQMRHSCRTTKCEIKYFSFFVVFTFGVFRFNLYIDADHMPSFSY